MEPNNVLEIIEKTSNINGWFAKESALLIASLDEIQKTNNISGDIFEIGVHHGKSTIFFGSLLEKSSESLGICDVFENQQLNISLSGKGNQKIFKNNMASFFGDNIKLNIFDTDSKSLTPKAIGTEKRMFHIDGGHSCDETYDDLSLAKSCISQKGIIILDDPFRIEWPGITEAIIKFILGQDEIIPIILGLNKIIFSHKKFADIYAKKIADENFRNRYFIGAPRQIKQIPFVNNNIIVIHYPERHWQTLGRTF